MAKPTFILIPYAAGLRGVVKAGQLQTFRNEGKALVAAERALGRNLGVVVVEQLPDEFAEPRLVKALGQVPETMLDSLAA